MIDFGIIMLIVIDIVLVIVIVIVINIFKSYNIFFVIRLNTLLNITIDL